MFSKLSFSGPLNWKSGLSGKELTSPNDKILEWSKLKAFADDKINMAEKLKPVLGRVENIVGKGEIAGYQHLLLFPTMFSKAFWFGVVKSQNCVVNSSACLSQSIV